MKDRSACCAPSRLSIGDDLPLDGNVVKTSRDHRDAGLVGLSAVEFLMGTDSGEGYRADGEGPARRVVLGAFYMASRAVTNCEFATFVRDTGYMSQAERCGWSFVFQGCVSEGPVDRVKGHSSEAPWWVAVEGACWWQPEGPGSSIEARADHPATQISWHDAKAYCQWSGTRLPTEAEWEFAARGGLEGQRFPWGNELTPGGEHRCNIWQGEFPISDDGSDGYVGTAPVSAFKPNGHGLYNTVGNVWEWCEDWFSPNYHRVTRPTDPRYVIPTGRRSMRGGSFLCHHSYCNRYRVAARSSNTPESATNHCGFRVAAE